MKKDTKAEIFKVFMNGILFQNPAFVLLLGMCPTLATSTALQNGFGMGLAATAVLVCSNVVVSAIRKKIPNKIRIAVFVVVIAGFVTMVDLLLQAFLPALSNSLGIFIPLIVVYCIIIARAEAFAAKNSVLYSAVDGLGMGLGFTGALSIISAIREVLGNGTIWGVSLVGSGFQPATLIVMPTGGFLVLGCVIAAVQYIQTKAKKEEKA